MTIDYIGSKWAGQASDNIEQLKEALQSHPLDSTFEEYGNFVIKTRNEDLYTLFGNFKTISYVFHLSGTKVETAELRKLIRANQRRNDYGSR